MYFKLWDPDANAKVTIRDLLSHRTGLKAHDDGIWLDDEKRSREEVVKAAMMSRPTARFREKFQYSNIMFDKTGGTSKAVRVRDFTNIGPAGSIISSARDMAQWLKLMIGRGVFEGRRLVSEKNFNELLTKHIRVQENADYGLGWGLLQWHGRSLISHTGGTEGFGALVELLPDQKLGFVFLSNAAESKLLKEIRGIIWGNLLDIH